MDFEFTEEQRIFREAIKNFAENEIGPLIKEAEETVLTITEGTSEIQQIVIARELGI